MADELMHDLVAGYAVDALDEDERSAFEAHLATCSACRDELEALGGPVLALAYAAPAAAPPPHLRGRVLAAARAERTNVRTLRPRWAYPALAAAVAASAAAVAFGIWAAVEHSRAHDTLTSRPLRGAAGTLVLSGQRAALVVSGLAPAPPGKTYEAWVMRGMDAEPAGLFAPHGSGTTVLRLTRDVPAGAQVGVTLERAGGAARPTTKPIVTSARA